MKRFLPFLFFIPLALLMLAGLQLNPRLVPSPLVGKTAPAFSLPELNGAAESISPQTMAGRAWLLNVWASWCVGCRAEHALLAEMQERGAAIVGLNYKDEPDAARAWLAEFGDPYVYSAADSEGAAALDWGVYGVPETFVIDGGGVVRRKHVGPLDETAAREIMLLLENLGGGNS